MWCGWVCMTANLTESEMLKQENPVDECAGEQVEKPRVRWISLFTDHDTGNIHKQLDGELKEGIPEIMEFALVELSACQFVASQLFGAGTKTSI